MPKFIYLTTLKNEKMLVNVNLIAYICVSKNGSEVCIGEFETYTVKETLEEIFALLS